MPLAGWKKFKEMAMPGTGSLETDAQFITTVLFESAMQADFDDIRFTEEDDTPLEQFRESYDNGVSSIWGIKIPSLPAGGKTIRVYYGNNSAALLSDGDGVFNLFDNFNGTNGDPPDPTKWTISDNDYVKIENNLLRIHLYWEHLDQDCSSIAELGVGHTVRFRMKKELGGTGRVKCGINNNYYYHVASAISSGPVWYYKAVDEGAPEHGDNEWHIIEIRRIDASLVEYRFDDVEDWTNDTGTDAADKGIIFQYEGGNQSDPFWLDWVIYGYIIHSDVTFGAEEDIIDADFSADDTTLNINQIVRFTDISTADDTIIYWLWDFGDGNASADQHPHHVYRRAGTYSVALTISTADHTNTETKSSYITVGERVENTWTGNMLDDIGLRVRSPKLDERLKA